MMKIPTIIISLLVVALVATNTWWAFRLLDAGVSYTHQSQSLEENQQALSQALAIAEALGTSEVTRARLIEAAQEAWGPTEPFEKDGYLWVGRLGLRFDESERLVEVVRGF
nr:putative integron gene cassette protein [uncultured bacterium]CAS02483.1 putative integron gene cassette protein [uncultured bacterium]